MPIGSIAAVAIGICLPLYSQVQTVTIGFPEGSVEISEGAYWHIAEAAGSVVGNELAELHLDAYFPYGAGREDEPAMSLARRSSLASRQSLLAKASPPLAGTSTPPARRDPSPFPPNSSTSSK